MADAAAGRAGDFVIATGQQISVREFVNKTAERLKIEIEWSGRTRPRPGP